VGHDKQNRKTLRASKWDQQVAQKLLRAELGNWANARLHHKPILMRCSFGAKIEISAKDEFSGVVA
jgi:hypothetical protein